MQTIHKPGLGFRVSIPGLSTRATGLESSGSCEHAEPQALLGGSCVSGVTSRIAAVRSSHEYS